MVKDFFDDHFAFSDVIKRHRETIEPHIWHLVLSATEKDIVVRDSSAEVWAIELGVGCSAGNNSCKKQKQTTATVLQPNNNATMSTNATNMVGQILMTPTNVTQIDLGKIGMHAYKMDVS